MAFRLYENTWETTTTTGTGAYSLGGAVSNARQFSAQYSNGDTFGYSVFDGNGAFEHGIGTWNTGNTITRNTILRSSSANTSVSWAAGTKQIMVSPIGGLLEGLQDPTLTGYPRKTGAMTWAFDSAGQIPGVAGNTSASAGSIGQIIESTQTTPQSLTSGTALTVTSISLTAGAWDVAGNIQFSGGASTMILYFVAGISATTNSVSITAKLANELVLNNLSSFTGGLTPTVQTPTVRVNLNATTTYYLVAQASFTMSTASAAGYLRATRVF